MKKLMISAALLASLAVPAIAQSADTAADPFVSTQGTTDLAVVGGMSLLVLIAAATHGDGSSGTGTD